MDRRTFIAAAGASVAVAAHSAQAGARSGETVRLSGWLRPVGDGPGHYFVLAPQAGRNDPASTSLADWPRDLVRVYPKDATRVRGGKVTLAGRLYRGHFADIATGHAAGAVLTDAVLV